MLLEQVITLRAQTSFINIDVTRWPISLFLVWVPIFPKYGSISIPFFHGLFGASGGMMLVMKTFYTEKGYQLNEMMYFYACLTLIMHIQTFFFTPITVVPKNQDLSDYSVFENVRSYYFII